MCTYYTCMHQTHIGVMFKKSFQETRNPFNLMLQKQQVICFASLIQILEMNQYN